MIRWSDEVGGTRRLFTDRAGGVSEGPYAGLNLGDHVGDESAHVRANRALVARAAGVAEDRLVVMRQVHGCGVVVVDEVPAVPPEADALVTTRPGLALAVLVADCTPVLLAERSGRAAAVVHAGREGLRLEIVGRTLATLHGLGMTDLVAAVGPSVCGRCYEVPPAMRADVAHGAPAAWSVSWTGTASLDVAAGVVEQLTGHGIPVTWVPGCSREDPDLYSHRRDQVTGRYGGITVLRGAP